MDVLNHPDLFILICDKLSNMKDIIKLESLSSYHHNLIRNTIWYKHIYINTNSEMKHIERFYKLRNMTLDKNVDVFLFIDYISKCHSLHISNCVGINISKLSNLCELTLDHCYFLNNENLKYLSKLDTLNISGHRSITNDGMQHLSNLTKLNVSGCNITDMGLKYLTKLIALDLSNCDITDEGLKFLTNIKDLYLSNCTKITDKGIMYLVNARNLHLDGCNKITDNGAILLENVKVLNLRNTNITLKTIGLLRLKGCFALK